MNYSEIESNRFNLRILRGTQESLDPQAISHIIDAERADVAIIRIPATEQHTVHILDRTGFPYICADNLVYYACDLATYTPKPLRNAHLKFVPCSDAEYGALNVLVDKCFTDYTNHYYSNPVLDKTDILAGYKEWALKYATSNSPTQTCLLVKRGDTVIAFSTYRFEGNECEIILNGVAPEESRAGVYSDLVRFAQAHFKGLGCKTMIVSTQVQNYAVQKVWAREGFQLAYAYTTVHINALLGEHDTRALTITPTQEEINAIGQTRGDMNPIHFDIEAALAQGLEGKTTHGLLINNILSRYYGTEYPGDGTIFAGYSYRFFKPLFIGQSYTCAISFPIKNLTKGVFKSVVQVRNEATGVLCALVYVDLINKRFVVHQ